MARIRTIKPEFHLNEELFDLESESGLPIRVAYTGLWCQADREGRFKWKPRQLKAQILPYDQLDFERVLDALTTRGFVVKYASGTELFGYMPTFKDHQFINNKEKPSVLPNPNDCNILTREPRVVNASSTRGVKVEVEVEVEVEDKKENTLCDSDESHSSGVGESGNDKPQPARSSLRAWFEDVMWLAVPSGRKVGKDLTWEAVKKQKPDERSRRMIIDYLSNYSRVKATYDANGQFFAEMQDPVRVIRNKRYLDVLVPCGGGNIDSPADKDARREREIEAMRERKRQILEQREGKNAGQESAGGEAAGNNASVQGQGPDGVIREPGAGDGGSDKTEGLQHGDSAVVR